MSYGITLSFVSMKSSIIAIVALSALNRVAAESECRCFPGDSCWPSEQTWSSFNASVGGKLIRTVPLGNVCHDPQYDKVGCDALKSVWTDPITHIESSHSVMSALYANASCDPLAPREAECVIGTYVQYAVNASSADDISKTIEFAHERNIRLVIRNSAHDYLGKSTGAGALAIWTKNMKNAELIKWDDADYKGNAIKLGAGMSGGDAAVFAGKHGLAVTTGNCPSVGVAGGYIQGGGHGPLTSKFGMAADQALEYEVVDGTGKYLVASRKQNADLFWALSGGGGGTYGVVVSVTMKAYSDLPMTFGTLTFSSTGLTEDRFYEAVLAFQDLVPTLVDAGCVAIWTFTPAAFMLQELIAPGLDRDEVGVLLAPFRAKLKGIRHETMLASYHNYSTFQEALAPQLKNQANIIQGGSWLMPRSVIMDPSKGHMFLEVSKELLKSGAFVQFLGFNASKKLAVENAVLPAWRDTLIHAVVATPWNPSGTIEEGYKALAYVGEKLIPKWADLAPDSGTYLNEAVAINANWKKDFYGDNYDRLLKIKNKYDPKHVFYGITTVGSDYWAEQADKRLCKTLPTWNSDSEAQTRSRGGKDEL
ncbi:isoamyl alcohol oxidase [Xylariaceae sp. FL0662B]|nr:isoamyl alcohol oxidase [Xylariaceae sp. FL0662B]